jgi:hypothetical protein
MKIKWTKIRRIIKDMNGKDMEVMLVSSFKNYPMKAATNGSIIILNGDELKSDDAVIKGVAHEITHVLNNGLDCKTNMFKIEWDKNEKELKKRYLVSQ